MAFNTGCESNDDDDILVLYMVTREGGEGILFEIVMQMRVLST